MGASLLKNKSERLRPVSNAVLKSRRTKFNWLDGSMTLARLGFKRRAVVELNSLTERLQKRRYYKPAV